MWSLTFLKTPRSLSGGSQKLSHFGGGVSLCSNNGLVSLHHWLQDTPSILHSTSNPDEQTLVLNLLFCPGLFLSLGTFLVLIKCQ